MLHASVVRTNESLSCVKLELSDVACVIGGSIVMGCLFQTNNTVDPKSPKKRWKHTSHKPCVPWQKELRCISLNEFAKTSQKWQRMLMHH